MYSSKKYALKPTLILVSRIFVHRPARSPFLTRSTTSLPTAAVSGTSSGRRHYLRQPACYSANKSTIFECDAAQLCCAHSSNLFIQVVVVHAHVYKHETWRTANQLNTFRKLIPLET